MFNVQRTIHFHRLLRNPIPVITAHVIIYDMELSLRITLQFLCQFLHITEAEVTLIVKSYYLVCWNVAYNHGKTVTHCLEKCYR